MLTCVLLQGHYLACMTAVLKQMDDQHYAHHVSTFKTRQDITVRVPVPPSSVPCPPSSVPRPFQWGSLLVQLPPLAS